MTRDLHVELLVDVHTRASPALETVGVQLHAYKHVFLLYIKELLHYMRKVHQSVLKFEHGR